MSKNLSFPNTEVRFQILQASLEGEIATMFDKSQTCKLVVIINCKLKSRPHNNSYVTSLGSTNSFRVSSLGLLSSSAAKKKYEYCANENLTTGNLFINVVIFIFPLANLEELKI